MAKKRKKPAPPPAAKSPRPEPVREPAKLPRRPRWMAALCYLGVLILIPACSRDKTDPFVRFHLNQGLVLLAAGTVCGALYLTPYVSEIGFYLSLLVDALSLGGLVQALRGLSAPLPGVGYITRSFHPFG